MKKQLLLLALTLIYQFAMAQDYLTRNIYSNVFNIKYNGEIGTTFIIENDSSNYFVTAKHILIKPNDSKSPKYGDKITFEILRENSWVSLNGNIYFDSINLGVDVIVIKPNNMNFRKTGIDLKGISTIIGDEGFFLGFPYNLKTDDKENKNNGFPFPLVKKGVLSGLIFENNISILLLDGHNNPGFSGGPVFFKNRFNDEDELYHLVGVISAYQAQINELITPLGTFQYSENSGIIIALGQRHIYEIIQGIP